MHVSACEIDYVWESSKSSRSVDSAYCSSIVDLCSHPGVDKKFEQVQIHEIEDSMDLPTKK
jgi:hypothetical protein